MPGYGMGLLDMMMLPGGGGGPFGNPLGGDYWSKVSATRQPGEDNSQVWFRGMLPQSMWPQQWRDQKYGYDANADKPDQADAGNASPDRRNARNSVGLMQMGLGMLQPRAPGQAWRWWG